MSTQTPRPARRTSNHARLGTMLAAAALGVASLLPAGAATPASATSCPVTSTTWRGVQRFYTGDIRCYTSPWFAGAHRVMISYGCNPSPWYPKNRLCGYRAGFHHGVDFDMPVGTPVRAAVSGTVVISSRLAGPAYGTHPVIIRSGGYDILLAHLSRRVVVAGQHVRAGQLIGYSGMSGVETEDGPHLHIEVRPAGRTYLSSVSPWRWIKAVAHH